MTPDESRAAISALKAEGLTRSEICRRLPRVSSRQIANVFGTTPRGPNTERDKEILLRREAGSSLQDISGAMGVSTGTVSGVVGRAIQQQALLAVNVYADLAPCAVPTHAEQAALQGARDCLKTLVDLQRAGWLVRTPRGRYAPTLAGRKALARCAMTS